MRRWPRPGPVRRPVQRCRRSCRHRSWPGCCGYWTPVIGRRRNDPQGQGEFSGDSAVGDDLVGPFGEFGGAQRGLDAHRVRGGAFSCGQEVGGGGPGICCGSGGCCGGTGITGTTGGEADTERQCGRCCDAGTDGQGQTGMERLAEKHYGSVCEGNVLMRRVVDGTAVGLSQVKWAGYQGSQRLISSRPHGRGFRPEGFRRWR